MIRKAQPADLNRVLEIFALARQYMKDSGNPNQWGDTWPARDVIEEDIVLQRLYLVERQGEIHGVFALIFGADPTYAVIRGEWLDDEPYAAIHRLASDGTGGVLTAAVEYALERIDRIRIDTHEDNATMHHLLKKLGFVRCGIIRCHSGADRVAYQRNK